MEKSKYTLAKEGKTAKISIVGDIGWDWFGVSYSEFKRQLERVDASLIEVDITSAGGIVTDGVAMMNALINHPATVHVYVNGQAASIASVIAMAGDKIFMPDNSLMFLHKPLNLIVGNADDMRKMADDLDKFETAIVNAYRRHFKGDDEKIHDLMRSETWMTAQEVFDNFNNVLVIETGGQKAAAHSDPVAVLGDMRGIPAESLLDKAVNAVRNRVTGNKENDNEEVEMITPEDRKQIVDEVTSSVIVALEGMQKEPDAPEAPAPADDDAVPFEGDMEDADAVEAHLVKVQMHQLKKAADLTTPDGVMAYQKALAKLQGRETAQTPPPSNTTAPQGRMGAAADSFSDSDCAAAVARMTN